jgi:hypothetical protein
MPHRPDLRPPAAANQPACYDRALPGRIVIDALSPEKTSPFSPMPTKKGTAHTPREKRKAKHIKDSYKKKGRSDRSATALAWRTVNKQRRTGAGKSKSR